MRRLVAVVLTAGLLAIPAVGDAGVPDDACDWISFRNGPHNHGASHCDGIGVTDVTTLVPAFLYRTRDSVTSTPAVVDGVVYVGTWDGWVYAFDQPSGVGDPSLAEAGVPTVLPKWERQIDDGNGVAFGRIVSSPAVIRLDGTPVVVIAGGATVYALHGNDGSVLAQLCLDPRSTGRCQGSDGDEIEVESSPVVVPDRDGGADVMVGLDVHNGAGIGRTGVVRARLERDDAGWSLTPVWKFDPEAGEAYSGPDLLTRGSGTGGGCGGVWGTPAVDPASDLVVFGTASCSSGRPDPFVDAGEKVFAVRFTDGSRRWRYDPDRRQQGAHADDDFGAAVQLFDIADRLVAGAGGKDGWYYAIDAATGAEVWKTHVGQAGHLGEDFAVGGIIGSPAVGEAGGKPALFVTTAISTPFDDPPADDPGRMLSLHALDAATGAVLWRQPLTRQTYGHPTYTNGIVLVPSTAGLSVQAFHADTGAPLWSSPPLNGAPSSGVAVTEDAIYLGAGTRQSDAGFKLTGDDSVVAALVGADPQERAAGVWGFRKGG